MIIDGQKLVKEINDEINHLKSERGSAVKSQWYEKAARLTLKIEGIKVIKQMIELGDFTIES